MSPRDSALERAKGGAWREIAAIDAAYERGDLDDAGWHRAIAAIVVPAFLSATTAEGGSGFAGDTVAWNWSRGLLAEALHRDGTLLDVGCANGLLMESMRLWGGERSLVIEPFGLDIAPELAALAKKRLPHWADRIHTGNALGWLPPMRFDFVRTGLEYVPRTRRRELVAWLLTHVVAEGGRLIVGKYNEQVERRTIEEQLVESGFHVTGRVERAWADEPMLVHRAVWIDGAPRP